jgi:hypothetical protein
MKRSQFTDQQIAFAVYSGTDHRETVGSRSGVTWYNLTLITEPKTFHIQSIYSPLGLKDSCHSRW